MTPLDRRIEAVERALDGEQNPEARDDLWSELVQLLEERDVWESAQIVTSAAALHNAQVEETRRLDAQP